jgi:hypothetical protein
LVQRELLDLPEPSGHKALPESKVPPALLVPRDLKAPPAWAYKVLRAPKELLEQTVF